ncbi:hypothetical protein SAMN05216589_0222 [Halopseudomonas bauzanensis]|uniref:Uncharacterized protein n=1 Tax=Halopseudomonas bauzanensis TaxID=653930 RepID=A0A1H9NBS3_9GAMM|nr:hypothetical protein SAMN05216589_0222 [Halopseudomonas bauzanensis]
MSITHSHSKAGMAKDFLQREDVAALLDKMTSEAMT